MVWLDRLSLHLFTEVRQHSMVIQSKYAIEQCLFRTVAYIFHVIHTVHAWNIDIEGCHAIDHVIDHVTS